MNINRTVHEYLPEKSIVSHSPTSFSMLLLRKPLTACLSCIMCSCGCFCDLTEVGQIVSPDLLDSQCFVVMVYIPRGACISVYQMGTNTRAYSTTRLFHLSIKTFSAILSLAYVDMLL